jgi:hypothetical protein
MPQAFEEAPLSCVAQVQKYAPATGAEANPVIAEILLTRGEMERGGRDGRSASKLADVFILLHLFLILSSHSL